MDKETARVEAFSDGVFAIAITLLVLEFRAPEGNLDGGQLAHRLIEPGVECDQYAGERARQRGKPPGQSVNGMKIDSTLCRQQRALPGRSHPNAPASEAQE